MEQVCASHRKNRTAPSIDTGDVDPAGTMATHVFLIFSGYLVISPIISRDSNLTFIFPWDGWGPRVLLVNAANNSYRSRL